jgi:hypothetical protein
MTNAKTIAGLIGPTLVAIAAGILLNLGSVPAIVEQGARDLPLTFVWGIILFAVGLAIVRAHNHWVLDWSVLVTLLGWLAILGGLLRMLFVTQLSQIAPAVAASTSYVTTVAIVFLVVGAFLTLKALGRD